jgi:hypothetical protein
MFHVKHFGAIGYAGKRRRLVGLRESNGKGRLMAPRLRSSTRASSFLMPPEIHARPQFNKNMRLLMDCLIVVQDRSGHFATAVAFSPFETLADLAQASLQAFIGQQDLDNVTKLAWTAARDCN